MFTKPNGPGEHQMLLLTCNIVIPEQTMALSTPVGAQEKVARCPLQQPTVCQPELLLSTVWSRGARATNRSAD